MLVISLLSENAEVPSDSSSDGDQNYSAPRKPGCMAAGNMGDDGTVYRDALVTCVMPETDDLATTLDATYRSMSLLLYVWKYSDFFPN